MLHNRNCGKRGLSSPVEPPSSLFDVAEQEGVCAQSHSLWILSIFIPLDAQLRLPWHYCPGLQPCCEGKNWGKFTLEFQNAFILGTRVGVKALDSRGFPPGNVLFLRRKMFDRLGRWNEMKEKQSARSLPGYLKETRATESPPFIVKQALKKALLHNGITIKGAFSPL